MLFHLSDAIPLPSSTLPFLFNNPTSDWLVIGTRTFDHEFLVYVSAHGSDDDGEKAEDGAEKAQDKKGVSGRCTKGLKNK